MIVYLLYEHYYDGAECWNNVVGVYGDETEAGLVAIDLNEKEGYADKYSERSYHVKPMEVQ